MISFSSAKTAASCDLRAVHTHALNNPATQKIFSGMVYELIAIVKAALATLVHGKTLNVADCV
jgi:hypothetical protein